MAVQFFYNCSLIIFNQKFETKMLWLTGQLWTCSRWPPGVWGYKDSPLKFPFATWYMGGLRPSVWPSQEYYMDDLVSEINILDKAVNSKWRKLAILLDADDIVHMANGSRDLQCVLRVLSDWCKWRGMNVNRCIDRNVVVVPLKLLTGVTSSVCCSLIRLI